MKNKIIKCHIKYQDTENDTKTSKDDNKSRRLIIFIFNFVEKINYIFCYNITELNQNNYYKTLFSKEYMIIKKERIFLLEEEFKKYANDTNIRLSELEDIEALTNKVCRCMGNKINRS